MSFARCFVDIITLDSGSSDAGRPQSIPPTDSRFHGFTFLEDKILTTPTAKSAKRIPAPDFC
jgi:hypothetical protein